MNLIANRVADVTGQAVLSGAVGAVRDPSRGVGREQDPSRGVCAMYQAAAAWTGAKKSGGLK